MVGSTIIQVSVGLWLAFTLNDISIGQKYLTSIVFTAYLIPTVVVSLVALFLFDQSFGLFHMIGSEWFNLWDSTNYILGSNTWAMPLVILIGSWKFSIFVTIFALAQLRSIPVSFLRSSTYLWRKPLANVQGDITFPRLKGIILTVILLRGVFMFNKFDLIWMLTEGALDIQRHSHCWPIKKHFRGIIWPQGTLTAVMMFLILALSAILYFKAASPSQEAEV